MTIDRGGMGIIPDNDNAYFSLLQAAIESVDELSSMSITKYPESYHFRVSPSHPMYIDSLIDSVIRMNTLFHIRVNFSKSIKNSCSVSFTIPIIKQEGNLVHH